MWRVRQGPAPALVTTGPASSGGVIGAPGTSVLFGGPLDYEEQSGGRFTLGYWFGCCRDYGIEGSFFFLSGRSTDFTASSSGDPLLARPFFAVNTGFPAAELVASPGTLAGTVTVDSRSKLWGAEVNGLFNIGHCGMFDWNLLGPGRCDFIAGFRYVQLDEDLSIGENLTGLPGGPTPGVNFVVGDRFSTKNEFYGGQVGLRREWAWRRWTLDVTGKVALGTTHQEVDISGFTTITPPGGPSRTFAGGLLAQPTNIGTYDRNVFSVVPEVGVNLGYQVTQHMKLLVGYNFLYWTHVARPGDQIDLGVNTTQVPRFNGGPGTLVGPARPAFTFRDGDFWAQGVNFGLEFRW